MNVTRLPIIVASPRLLYYCYNHSRFPYHEAECPHPSWECTVLAIVYDTAKHLYLHKILGAGLL